MAEKKRRGLLFDEVLPEVRRTAQSLLSLDPQEDAPASQQALEMALGFVPGVGQAMALRDIERARRAEDPAAAAMAAASFIPFGRLLGRGAPGPIMSELDVYHGTPHRFPATEANPLGEFDASKIGTGEGAQAYGHGSYFAENPNVAEGYRKTLGEQQNPYKANVAMSRMAALVDEFDGDVEKAADRFMQSVYETPKTKAKMRQNLIDEFQTYSPKGQLYKADLPDEMIDRMLDWDKRISDQPEFVKAAWQSWQQSKEAQKLKKQLINQGRSQAEVEKMFANPTGQTMHGWIYEGYGSSKGGEKPKVAKFLQSQGVLGVKYQDAGSRGQGGTGTRNFVVFPGEEKKVKILERK